jgi:hypothetical protein
LRPRRVLGLCLAALAAFYLTELLYHGILCVLYPYDLNYGEGYVLNDALRLWRGEQIWTDITRFPMVRSAYPPIYLLLTGLLTSVSPSFLGPRLVALLSALAIGAMLAWHGRRIAGWIPAVVVSGLWVGSTFVYQWAPLARVDMLGVLLSLAAVLVVTGGEPDPATRFGARPHPRSTPEAPSPGLSQRERRLPPLPLGEGWGEGVVRPLATTTLLIAAILCSLALLTKQTFFAAPLAIALYLALRRDRRVLWFAAGVVVIVGGATLALNAGSAGQYAQHVLFGNSANPYRVDRTVEMLGLFLRVNAIAVVAATWAAVVLWLRGRPTLVGVYIPLALATLLTAGNVSSDVNYFLEPTVALALAVPFAWRAASAWPGRAPLGPTLAVAQLVLLVHIPNGYMSDFPPGPAKGSTPVEEDVRVGDQVEAILQAAGPNALVELAGFAVFAGAPVWIQPIDLQAEQRRGRWSPELLNASIDEHRWSVVVLSYKFLPAEAMAALEHAYEQTDGLTSPNGLSYFIYRPRAPS